MAERGRMNVPVRVFSIAEYERQFGPSTRGELAAQVRQFFNNGGGTAWIGRVANGAVAAEVMLRNQAGGNALLLQARDPGLEGNLIRAEVDYDTGSPEETFNLTVFRSRLKADGTREREALESFKGLSMNPDSGAFVERVVNVSSNLARATASAPAGITGVSISGLVLPSAEAAVEGVLNGIVTAATRAIRVTLGNHAPVTVSLSTMADIPASGTVANIAARWTTEINSVLSANGIADTVMVNITGNTVGGGGVAGGRLLTIGSAAGPVRVSQASGGDASVGLMLGVGAGGIEGSGYGDARPAPTGVVARMGLSTNTFDEFREFAGSNRDDLVDFTLTDDSPNPPYSGPVALGGAVPMFQDAGARSFANVRTALDVIAAQIAATAVAGSQPFWSVRRHGIRLALQPRYGGDNTGRASRWSVPMAVEVAMTLARARSIRVMPTTLRPTPWVNRAALRERAPSRPHRCQAPMAPLRPRPTTRPSMTWWTATSICSICSSCRARLARTMRSARRCGGRPVRSALASGHS